tara:strand:+ start:12639 stop:13367 length:729 start_codon:yes stop_codon:yes gene_type:complete
MGLDVVDLGLSTTPTVEMAVVAEKSLGGIILTASHNPIQWNALKLLNAAGEFISAQDISVILNSIEIKDYQYVDIDNIGSYTINSDYFTYHINAIKALSLINTETIAKRKFKVAIDAVNSTGGIAVPLLLNSLGVADIELINCEPTGEFAHNPDPLTENLTELLQKMKQGNFDIGIALDPDVHRLVFICENADPFNEEYTLVAVSDYILSHQKEIPFLTYLQQKHYKTLPNQEGKLLHSRCR